jgi:hypothetical protein
VQNDVVPCLHELSQSLTQHLLAEENTSDVQPVAKFAEIPNAFGAGDASPILIQRPQSNQKDYYSGKYKGHCVRI